METDVDWENLEFHKEQATKIWIEIIYRKYNGFNSYILLKRKVK